MNQIYSFKSNMDSYQENRTFLSRPYGSKDDFLNQYSKLFNEKEKSKQLYIQVLCELKVAIFEGNFKNFKNLSDIFSYIIDYEKIEELASYFHEDIYPFKGTNIIILTCKYNRLEILKHIFSNYTTIYEHLFKNEKKLLSPDDVDENLHNAFYYSIRMNNVELVQTLIKKWPGDYFDTHLDKLDTILSKAYEELKLKNVLLSEAIEVFIEEKLINLRFFSSKTTSVQNNKISLPNISERIVLLIEEINSSKLDSEVNEEFLFILKNIVQNINTLKRQIKITYSKLPWEEMEFCLVCFVLSFTQQKEINLFYRAVLNKARILKHLANFCSGLESIKDEIGTYRISALSNFPKISRKLNTTQIIRRNPEFEALFSDYQKIRDIHSLNTISTYVTLALSADVKTKEGQLTVTRCLQVIGECMKNTLQSPKLSSYMCDLLLLSLPRKTREVVIDLRNSLSHVHSLSQRIEIQQNVKLSFLQGVQDDIKKIGHVITDILFENKLKALKNIMETIINTNDLKEVEEIMAIFNIEKLDNMIPENLHLSECKKFSDIVEKLKSTISDKTKEEQEIFVKMDEIIYSQSNKLTNKVEKYSYGISELNFFNKTLYRRIDEQVHRSIKFMCNNVLSNIAESSVEPRTLKCLAELAVRLLSINEMKKECSELVKIKSDASEALKNFEAIKALVFEIICIADIQLDNVQWVNDLREQLSNNKYADQCQAKNYVTKDEYRKQLAFKLLDLKSVLKANELEDPRSIPLVKSNVKLIAALEMLILDILSLLGQLDKRLEDSFFYLDQNIPYLIGKNLRNHLAHYNTVTDILPSDPATVLILNAQIIAEKLEANPAKIGKYVEEELSKLKSKASIELKVITLKEKMFDALEAGDFEILKSCIAQGADIHSRKRDNWTTLHAAAKGGNVSIVKFLVDQKVNIDVKSANQQNPLHVAAASGSVNVVEYFIQQQYYALDDVDDTLKTPLHLATLNNQITTIEILLKHKADFSARDKSGESPLHYAVQQNHLEAVKLLLKNEKSVDANEKLGGFTPLHLAADVGSLDVVHFLVSQGANVNATSYAKELPLHLAAFNGHTEVVKILIAKSSEINARSLNGCTPLLYATENGHKEISDILLKNGANPNIFDKSYNYGPIHHTTKNGHVEILKALLSHNANTNVITVDGKSPLNYAVGFGQLESVKVLHEQGVTLKGRDLHLAVQHGHLDIVEYLINQKVDVNVTDEYGLTPLHYAAYKGRDDIVTLLIKRNAKVNARNADNGFTPLLVALAKCIEGFDQLPDQTKSALQHIYFVQINHINVSNPTLQQQYEKVVEILLNNGADANAKTATETSALHYAAASGNCSIVKMLLQRNVSVNQQCKLGFTPMHSAVMFGHKQIVELLLESRARIHFKTFFCKATVLHFAVEYGHKNIVKLLLANNANINEKNAAGWSPAAITFKENRAEILEVLIQNGADVHDNKEKILSLSIAKGSTDVFKLLLKHTSVKNDPELSGELLHLAITKNNVEVVNALIAHGVDLNSEKGGYPALLHAVVRKQEKIVEILLKNGAAVNGVKKPEGTTALHLAAMVNNVEIVEILLNNGINVNARNIKNNTALHLALTSGFFRTVKFLFSLTNVDVNETGYKYDTLLHMAAEGGNVEVVKFLLERGAHLHIINGNYIKAIHVAIIHGRLEVLEYFLDQGMDVRRELDIFQRTLLHYAVMYNRLDIAEFLIQRGADVNAADAEGNTPLLQAASDTTTAEFITLLLENGAMYNLGNELGEMPINKCKDDRTRLILFLVGHLFRAVKENELIQVTAYTKIGVTVNARNAENLTPLHLAAREGHDDIVRVLLENKSDPNALGPQGFTPLHYAATYGHLNVCLTLSRHGAIYDATDEDGKTPMDLSEKKAVTDFLKQIHGCFEKVANKNTKIIGDLKKLKEKDVVKSIMRARNRDGKTLLATAVLHDFPKVDELKEMLQTHLNDVLEVARSLCAREKFDTALKIYAMALEVRTEILGKNNLGTLDVRGEIALVLCKQQKYDEALNIFSEMYEQYKGLLGETSKATLNARGRLALILHRLARNDEAIAVYEDICEKQRKTLSMDDPDFLETLVHKAMVLLALGRNKEALKIYTSAYRRLKNQSGANHPKTLVTRNGIAMALKNLGNHEEALNIFRKVHEVKKKVVGLHHSDTLRTYHYIVLVLEAQKNYAEALEECKDLLKTQEQHLGPDHLDTLNTQQTMAKLYCQRGMLIDALKIYNQCLPAMRLKLGPNHPNVRTAEHTAETIKDGFQRGGNPEILNALKNLTKEAITAARSGDLEALKSLIRSDLGINDPDEEGRTPLHFACDNGHYDVALLLLDSGANATATCNMGNTPLHIAALKGREEIAKLLLGRVERGALLQYVNAKTRGGGNTALHAATKAGHCGVVCLLLVNGASYDVLNKKGKTPLELTQSYHITELLKTIVLMFEQARTGNAEVVRSMQSAERELLNVFANVRNAQGRTLMQVAAYNSHKQIAYEILKAIT